MSEKIISFGELHARQPNALEQLRVLAHDPEWNAKLQDLYWQGLFLCYKGFFPFDTDILQRISPGDFIDYFPHALRGVEYAQSKWGKLAVPSRFEVFFALNHEVHGLIPRYIGYNRDKDEFGITVPHIFEEINGYSGRALSNDIHLPVGIHVSPEDHTTLQAIEECRHKYQVHGLGRELETFNSILANPNYHKENENEQEMSQVWSEAIKDLGIKTYTL